jgi:hypothetical protein
MRQDEIDRGVLLVYKTRNTGYFNYRMATPELKTMPVEARLEFARMLRNLADDVDPSDCKPRELVEYAALTGMSEAVNHFLKTRQLVMRPEELGDAMAKIDEGMMEKINNVIREYASYMEPFEDNAEVSVSKPTRKELVLGVLAGGDVMTPSQIAKAIGLKYEESSKVMHALKSLTAEGKVYTVSKGRYKMRDGG